MNNVDNGFDGIALIDFGGFVEDEEGHFFRHDLIVFAQVLNQVKVLGLEVDDFADKRIMLQTSVFHIIKLIAMLDKQGHELEGVLELSGVVVVAHGIPFLCFGEGRLILQDEVKNLLDHHVLLAVTTHETVLLH